MAGYVVIGALAAFGLMCSVWILGTMLLPGWKQRQLLIVSRGNLLRRCMLLRDVGILPCRLAVWDGPLCPEERIWLESRNVEIWNSAQIWAWFETGAKAYGTGTGDPPGCHQCGGVSEL